MVKLVVGVIFLGLVFQLVASAVNVDRLNIWPMPKSVSYGHQVLYMSKDFELRTEGSKYPDASGILKDGFSRLLYVIHAPHVADGTISHFQQSLVLQGIHVLISSPNDKVMLSGIMIATVFHLHWLTKDFQLFLVRLPRSCLGANIKFILGARSL